MRRAALPVAVFLVVVLLHFLWLWVFPEQAPEQSRWVTVPTRSSPLRLYLERQDYWLGYSYALPLAFAAVALRRYRDERGCVARNAAVGGVSLSGVLAVAGCYLVGCCGSPMLAVYVSLFGAGFAPLAKPTVAALTTVFILAGWWMLTRRRGLGVGAGAGVRERRLPVESERSTS